MARRKLRKAGVEAAIIAHRALRDARVDVHLEPGGEVRNVAEKRYGDSWTCRSSTKALLAELAPKGFHFELASSGKDAFLWGAEGLVDFHYYGLDRKSDPRVLIDATAHSNFARDLRPTGVMHPVLLKMGEQLGDLEGARKLGAKIVDLGPRELLVIRDSWEIALFRSLLEVANKELRLHRDQEH